MYGGGPPARKSSRGGANTSITSVSSGKKPSCSMPPGITTMVARHANAALAAEPEFHLALEHIGDLLVVMFMGSGVRAGLHAPPHHHTPIAGGDFAGDLVGDALLGQRGKRGKAGQFGHGDFPIPDKVAVSADREFKRENERQHQHHTRPGVGEFASE